MTLQVLAGGGMTAPLMEIGTLFEAATGYKVAFHFGATPQLIKLATSGNQSFDLAVVPREVFSDGGARAHFNPAPTIDVARVGLGIAVRAGAGKPDIGTPQALRQALLAATSVAFLPGSAAGAQILKTFEKLGIAKAMKAKTKALAAPSEIPRAVANGEAELGLFILNVLKAPGVELVGPFPAELQQNVVYTTAVGVNAADADAARQFIDFLRAPAAVAVIRSQGMTPV